MTTLLIGSRSPAVLGGAPAFPASLPLVRPTLPDTAALAQRLRDVLDSGMLTNGPMVRELEERVATYLGVPHVVAVSSCTSGLLLVMQALGFNGPVITPSFTFSATAHAVHWVGGVPRFTDIDPASLTLDPGEVRRQLGGARGVVATHVYGTPCEVEALDAIGLEHGVPVVYDAAHGLGSRRRGRLLGSSGAAEVFSLSPTKVVVAGEGGLVATSDGALAETLRIGRDYGNPGDYDCRFPGLNARMSELHAVVALASLEGLDERVAHRGALATRVHGAVRGHPGIDVPYVDPQDTSTYKDLTLLIDPEGFGLTAAELARALAAEGVDTRRYYEPAVHRQRAYADLPSVDVPVTDLVAERVISLPLWSHMTEEPVDRMAEAVLRIADHAPAVRRALRRAEGPR